MSTTLKNSYRDLILAAGLVILLAGAWWWLDGWINSAAENLLTLKSEVENNLISESDLFTLQRKLDQTAAARNLVDKAVVTEATVDVLLAKLESVAAASGLDLNISNVTADKNLTISLTGEGTFKQWFKFLQLILSLDYGLTVDQLTWSSGVEGTEQGDLWSGTLKLAVNNFVINYEK